MTIEEEAAKLGYRLDANGAPIPLAEPARRPRLVLGDLSQAARESTLRSFLHMGAPGRAIIDALYKGGKARAPKHITQFSDADYTEENARVELKRLHRLWKKTHAEKYTKRASEIAHRFPHLAKEYTNE